MAISSVQKQKIQPGWPLQKIQQEATNMVANQIVARMRFAEDQKPEEVAKYIKETATQKAEALQTEGIRTPFELVKALAEYKVNVFGCEASIAGDDKTAILFNERPTMWLAAKNLGHMRPDQEELLHHQYKEWMKYLGQAFGFETKVEIMNDGNSSTVTFSKR